MKFFYFINQASYFRYTAEAGANDIDVCFSSRIDSLFLQRLYNIHNSWRLNKRHEMPFRDIWLRPLMENCEIESDEEVCFLMCENLQISYSKRINRILRERFPLSKFVFILVNPIDKCILQRLLPISDYYDAIVTFNEVDAKKYDFLYCPQYPYKIPILMDDSLNRSDFFFVGADKGRLELLIRLYEKLTSLGYKCDFHITEVPKERQIMKTGITYNGWMNYETVLKHTYNTKCVVEIIKGDYISQRTQEALTYHKKVLTTNRNAIKLPYYNRLIFTIGNVDSMDFSFIKEDIPDSEFERYVDFRNFDSFKQFLIQNVK